MLGYWVEGVGVKGIEETRVLSCEVGGIVKYKESDVTPAGSPARLCVFRVS